MYYVVARDSAGVETRRDGPFTDRRKAERLRWEWATLPHRSGSTELVEVDQ